MLHPSFPLFIIAAASMVALRPRRTAPPIAAPERLTPSTTRSLWHPGVPLQERIETVTVLPYHPRDRATRIVEVFGDRRELLYVEGARR